MNGRVHVSEMPQEFQVLRCYQCSTFQVHQVKKAKKWSCKMCGEKQSVIKVFGRGVAADCRHHVQKLNSLRGEIEQVTLETGPSDISQLDISHQQTTEDNTNSVDRWSRFVTPYLEEGDTEENEHDDRFTTDMAELRQKQMARKRKRNQRDNDCEDESSDQSQFIFGRSQIQDKRQIRVDNSPGRPYTDVRGKESNVDHFENNTFSQEYKSVHSVYSVKNNNKGQGHWSNLGENVAFQHSGYHVQRDMLIGDRPCSTANEGQGNANCQGMNKVQTLNRYQSHNQVQDKGQINKGQVHLASMKKNQNASKWSKYQNDSDSCEETDILTEQSINGTNICEKVQNQNLYEDEGKISGIATSVQSKIKDSIGTTPATSVQSKVKGLTGTTPATSVQNKVKGLTGTTWSSSVRERRPRDFLNTSCSSTLSQTSNDEMWRESQYKTCNGRTCPEDRDGVLASRFIEDNDNRSRGDNSNSLTGLEEKQGNTDSVNQDSFVRTRNPNCQRYYQTSTEQVTRFSEGFLNSYMTEHDITPNIALSSLSHVTRCNQGRGHSGHIVSQKSTSLQSMFVTEDITDEDLLL